MKKLTADIRLDESLKLAVIFQGIWIVIAGFCVLIGRPIEGNLLLVNLLILFAPTLMELVTRVKLPRALQIHFYIFVTAAGFLGSIVGFYGSICMRSGDNKTYGAPSHHIKVFNNRFSTVYAPYCGTLQALTWFNPTQEGNELSGNVWHETGLPMIDGQDHP